MDCTVLKRKYIFYAIGWTILCFLSAYWNIATEKSKTLELAQKEALTVFDKDQALRFWASNHGGIYVFASKTTPPNKNLSHIPERDVVTPSGKLLTLMNPAYMLRQVMSQYAKYYSAKGHITSLKLLNPDNQPDQWEVNALKAFNEGSEEILEVAYIQGKEFLRFMRPMYTNTGCLKCHSTQGYKVGDVRGGVSVSLPLEPYRTLEEESLRILYITHLFFLLCGISVIIKFFFGSKKRTIERIEAANALHEHSEKIKFFAYSVVHDLKNPILSIHGLTKLIRKKYKDKLDEKGRDFCDKILKSSSQINLLVEQINAYIAAKEHPISIEKIDLLEICHSVKDEYSRQLSERNINWTVPKSISKVQADKMAILRIIRNFVDNALKYGGKRLSDIEICYNESDKFHIISVSNNGNLLSAEDYQDFFVPFKRNDTANMAEGAGLGLAIIKELVGLHRGDVWCESDGKTWVIFKFTIAKSI